MIIPEIQTQTEPDTAPSPRHRKRLGRPTMGLDHLNKLDGTADAKTRARLILETLTGERSIPDAAEQLGIKEARFHVIRDEALQAIVKALESRTPGRKPKPAPTAKDLRIAELEAALQDMGDKLHAARIREKLALTLPHVFAERSETATTSGKKTTDRETSKRKPQASPRGKPRKKKGAHRLRPKKH